MRTEKTKKKPVNYIDKAVLYEQLTQYVTEYKFAKENGLELPKISNEIGKSIMLIAENLAKSPNFISYSYKEDMIADGIENCLLYLYNFNPERSTNAFAYITQICWYAAVRRIVKENKQKQIKSELIKNSGILDMDFNTQFGDDEEYKSSFLEFLKANLEPEKTGEDSKNPPKKIIKRTTKTYQANQKALLEKEESYTNLAVDKDISEDLDIKDSEETPLDFLFNDDEE